MSKAKRVGILTLLGLSALGCYFVGSMAGVFVLFILGMVFELGFWIGLFGRSHSNNK